jgi:hypothetical protein
MDPKEKEITEEKGKKEVKVEKKPSKPEPPKSEPPVVMPHGITLAQFIRSEDLGFSKEGFAHYIREKGIGGRKSRVEWMALYRGFKATPVSSLKR